MHSESIRLGGVLHISVQLKIVVMGGYLRVLTIYFNPKPRDIERTEMIGGLRQVRPKDIEQSANGSRKIDCLIEQSL